MLDPEYIPTEYATGVVVDRAGLILTVNHVLGDREKNDYVVWIARRGYRATVLAGDPTYDLAVLKIEADSLTPITLGDAGDLKKGQIAISLGNPLAIARDGAPSATWGIISNLHRKAAPETDPSTGLEQKDTLHHYGTLIQTDARLERGTSGGALLNLKGEMIGITSDAAALPGSEKAAGFAIPVNDTFRHVLQKLKLGQQVGYGFLGVAPDDAFPVRRDGVRIANVVYGTPAASAGLEAGDIVTHVDDVRLVTSGDLILHIAKYPAGEKVHVRLLRGGRPLVREVVLSKKYVRTARPVVATVVTPPWRGISIDYTTAHPRFVELSHEIDAAGCVVVTDVATDSPAWKAGLRSGLFISHVGGKRVSTPEEFDAVISKQMTNADVRLTIASQFNRLPPITVRP
jgi:S1-C subfamily serine protease